MQGFLEKKSNIFFCYNKCMNEQLKGRPGRPLKPVGEHRVVVRATISPEESAWLRAQPLGISATISALIEKAMKKK